MKTPQCNRAFAEFLAACVERKEPDWGAKPRLHQSNVDSAFILAIFLAIVAVILCSVR